MDIRRTERNPPSSTSPPQPLADASSGSAGSQSLQAAQKPDTAAPVDDAFRAIAEIGERLLDAIAEFGRQLVSQDAALETFTRARSARRRRTQEAPDRAAELWAALPGATSPAASTPQTALQAASSPAAASFVQPPPSAAAPPPEAAAAAAGPRPRPDGIRFVPSPHHSSRGGADVDAIVIHHTGGSNIDGTISWFKNPASKVSSHYVIGRDGEIVQMVDESRSAWHAGKAHLHGDRSPGVNARSVGIELVNRGDGKTPFTEAQMQSLARLTGYLMDRHDIPARNVVGHADVALPRGRKSDPASNFDWDRLFRDVGQPSPAPPTPTPPTPAPPGPAPGPQPLIRRGSRGAAVEDAQRRLAAAGFDPGPLDGIFGPRTQAAVRAYQRAHGLLVDGIVGPQTWGSLLA